MHTVTIFPLGNADSCRIDLANGRQLLFDYAQCRNAADPSDPRIDLAAALLADLRARGRSYYEVVAFTHAHDDHTVGAARFFYLDHAQKYQGAGRISIKELWVPAAMVIADDLDPDSDAGVLQAEARYRLIQGAGIRVFSRPEKLQAWFDKNDIPHDTWDGLVIDAGNTVPGFTLSNDGVEFFVHSPFATRLNDRTLVDHNEDALVLHATFEIDKRQTRMFLSSDAVHDVLADIVKVSRYHGRDERLEWEVFKIPHHCSYLSLGPDKGADVTQPVPDVKWLFEQGSDYGLIISSSKPIPSNDDDPQPPHRQAANYYKKTVGEKKGQFIVTMEHPKVTRPEPLEISVSASGASPKRLASVASVGILQRPAPRAGHGS